MDSTQQLQTWINDFGKEYTDRNIYAPQELDQFYTRTFGLSKTEMDKEFLGGREINSILEVGCNVGNQLRLLQEIGYRNLYGIEPQEYAVEKAKSLTRDINIIKGSAFDLPFKDNYFDLVFTAGVLIHINPNDIAKALQDIYRVSKRYIWGFEYYADNYTEIQYRGKSELLWKTNFAELYKKQFPALTLIKEKKYPYIEGDNVDSMFIFEKQAG